MYTKKYPHIHVKLKLGIFLRKKYFDKCLVQIVENICAHCFLNVGTGITIFSPMEFDSVLLRGMSLIETEGSNAQPCPHNLFDLNFIPLIFNII